MKEPTNYSKFVNELLKPGTDIIMSLDSAKGNLIHLAMGVAGEAGELLDTIKKHTIYNKELDYDNLIEELGDIEFFLQGIRNHFAISREDILKGNIVKLGVRYHEGKYSDKQAQERADK